MNRRQAQRSLADLISKCNAAHIQLPEDPLEARAEAVEAIIHSLKGGKANLSDAQDELQQKYGLELVWKQHMVNEEVKRQRRRLSRQKNRSKDPRLLTALGFLPESPPLNDQLEVGTSSDGEHQQEARPKASITEGLAIIPLKRRPDSQDIPAQQSIAMKISKKAKNARELIVPEAANEAEEKPPAADTNLLGHIVGDSDSSGSADHAEMLDIEGLDDVEGDGSEMSSDEEFAL